MGGNTLQFKIFDIFLLILYGILGCSGFSRTIFQDILGTIYMPEFFMLPLLFFLRKYFRNFTIDWVSLFMSLLVWGFLLVLGLLNQSIGSLFSTSRSFLYLFVLYIIFKNKNNYIDENVLMYMCFGSLIGWMLCVFYNFLHPEVYINARGEGYTYGNLITIPLFLYLSFNRTNRIIFYLGFIILIFLFFTSGLRRMMFVTIISFILVLLTSSTISFKNILRTFLILSFFIVLIVLNIERIGSAVYDASPVTYYRVFERYEESFDGTSQSDDERTENFIDYTTWQYDHLLPSGFLKTYEGGDFGKYNDFPLFSLCYTFGMFITYLIISIFVIQWIQGYFKYIKNRSKYIGCFLISGVIVFLLLIMEGAFLSNPVIIQFTALSLGSISRISKCYK